jgi:TolB-like protein/Tfp pilus assembly protein PilF
MAYYEGETLDQRIIASSDPPGRKDKPLPIEKAIDIAIQIARGLAKAHEKEIVHRDIKPANIMQTKEGVVKVLDFGLAKLSTQTKLTKESTTLGTVSYMSPEQAKGKEVDHRTDIWSLGVILYEMVTGQLPFKGEYESAVIYSIMNDTQEPVTGLRTGIPMELERIINKCLQKSAEDRYQHVEELVVDLKGLKYNSTGSYPIKEKKKRQPKSVLFSVAVLSFLILIVLGYLLILPPEEDRSGWENSIAVLPFDNISNDPEQDYFAAAMTEQTISNLSRLPRLKVIARQSVMKYKDSEIIVSDIGNELDVEYVLESTIRKVADRIRVTAQLIKTEDNFHIWSNDYDRDYNEDLFELQDDLCKEIASNLLAALTPEEEKKIKSERPNSTEAYQFYVKGRYFNYNKFLFTKRIEDFHTSEQLFKKAIELDPEFAPSYAGIADLYNSIYFMPVTLKLSEEQSKMYLELQESYIEQAYKLDANSADVLYVKGFVNWAKQDMDRTFDCFIKTLKLNPNHDRIYFALGSFLNNRGLIYRSIKMFDKGIVISPLEPTSYYALAGSFYIIGKFDKAEIDFKKAFQMEPNLLVGMREYVEFLITLKKYDEAEKMLERINTINPDYPINRY